MLTALHGLDEDDDGEEERLRLDDGTVLPRALSELRSLFQMHSSLVAEAAADPDTSRELADLREAKLQTVRECLMEFDDAMLFIHDKLLDHEADCRRLAVARKRNSAKPAGRCRYDEAISFDDGADGAASAAGAGAAESDSDDDMDLEALLKADAPSDWVRPSSGHAGGRSGVARAAASSSGGGAAAGGDGWDDGGGEVGDEEETLDQRVAASRAQIKELLRALEEGKRPGPDAGSSDGGLLPPVAAPSRRHEGFSSRLRARTREWSSKGVG